MLPVDAFPMLKRKSFGGRAHRHNYWLQRLSGQRHGSPWSQHAHARGAQPGLSPPNPPQPGRGILTQSSPNTRASTYMKTQPAARSSLPFVARCFSCWFGQRIAFPGFEACLHACYKHLCPKGCRSQLGQPARAARQPPSPPPAAAHPDPSLTTGTPRAPPSTQSQGQPLLHPRRASDEPATPLKKCSQFPARLFSLFYYVPCIRGLEHMKFLKLCPEERAAVKGTS